MASNSPTKSSKRKNIGKVIRRGYDRLKDAIQPSSHLSALNSGSTTVNSALASPGSTAAARLREAGDTAWCGLATALRMLEQSADGFPPLKSAVDRFIACLDVVQAASENRKDYKELASELTAIAGILDQYLGELGSEERSGSAARIALSIEAEAAGIDKQRGHGKAKRMIESTQDREDIVKRYRRIEGLFRQLQGDIGLRTWRNTNKQHVMTLLRGMSPVDDARYNSCYSTTIKRHGCTADTREKVQADLQEWVRDSSSANVYWMNGMAGTGKTTIAYSLCEWLETNGLLGASFFCSRVSSSSRDVNRIVPTVAYQLAQYSPAFRSVLCEILDGNPDTNKLDVVRQFEKLFRGPLLESKGELPKGVVIVIDALDECDNDYGVRLILETLLKFAAGLPVRFFVASRPEPIIRDKMLSPGGYSPATLHLHDIEQSMVENDIKKYLMEALGSMSPPPSDMQIEQLTKQAGKLFIYAATLVRYILPDKGCADSAQRLKWMLARDSQSTDEEPAKKYKRLNELYNAVISAAFDYEELEKKEIEGIRLVLWTAACAKEPTSIPTLALILGLTKGQVLSALQPLRSVLHVSESEGVVSILHTSFPDYLLDRSRSGDFWCDETQHSELLAGRCFSIMKEQLRFNICDLESSFVFDKDVPDLERRIKSCISPTLFYACQYWGEHLRPANASDVLHDELVDFLDHRLLFWMEVLSLNSSVVKGVAILIQAESWLQATQTPTDAQQKAADARDFVTRFAAGACIRSTPHIYLSALPFCTKSSSVYAHYWKRTKGLVEAKGTAINRRERAAQATWMTDAAIHSIAFSPDGTCIVSGSDNHIIRVWDVRTGEVVAGLFEGHTASVWSVVFSPDGTHIASGSDDRTIRMWDARTGNIVVGPFKGHTDRVRSVVFSPDGTRIGSGSFDRTIRVWDTRTGDIVAGPFKGHLSAVNSVAFSPEGTRIVSASNDTTIRIWDARTGEVVAGPFQEHTSLVRSVAFAPDGKCIVSGSFDKTIRIWDAHTGDVVAEPFKGHTSSVWSVAFSPDGTRIVSGSYDKTIRVWDVRTGNAVAGPFKGHTRSVQSVVFSPDGTRIISGSDDHTIRIWDLRIREAVAAPFKGHVSHVKSVAFSLDGARIVSGSDDRTIRVWDSRTGDIVAGPFKGHLSAVNSVAFSPDGTRIVSASNDTTIQIWDAHTGEVVAGPFLEHYGLVFSAAFSPDGTRIVTGSYDKTLQVWDVCTGDIVAGPFEGHTSSVWSVAFSPDGTRIVSGSFDNTVRVWDARIGDVATGPFKGHQSWVLSVAFSPDGTRIVSGSDDRTIRVWDVCSGNTVAGPFEGHTSSVRSVAFSPDGTCIVSGADDHTIRLWDASTGDIVAGPLEGHTDPVSSVAFSLDGTLIVSGSEDQTIRVWNVRIHDTIPGQPNVHTGLTNSSSVRSTFNATAIASNQDNNQDVSSLDVSTALASDGVQDNHCHDIFIGIRDFKFNRDGWVTAGNVPIFWVSPDFYSHLPHPHNTLVIGPSGTTSIDYQQLLLGERWSECYISQ